MAAQELVGQRIKNVRRQRGLSQAQLAHPELSDSYVSLIESGKRTPTPAVLELLAQKLDCSLTYLVNGVTAEQMEELEVGLSFARMALENGAVAEACQRYADLLRDRSLAGLPALSQDAGYGYALSLEACGRLSEAITVLTGLNETLEPGRQSRKIAVTLALSRCYRELGDFSAAVRVGEQVLTATPRMQWTDELVELGATVLVAYLVRGDLLRAAHFAAELLSAAETLQTPRAIVASCWNAAIVAERAGRGDEAMSLIERALAIQSENGEPRNLTRLRQDYAYTMLRVRPEQAETARDILLRAQREHGETATSRTDMGRCVLALAYAELVLGDPARAAHYVQEARELLPARSRSLTIEAELILAQAHAVLGEPEESTRALESAAEWLLQSPPTPTVAGSWLASAELYERIGDHDEEMRAYRRALACAGL